MFGLRTRIFSSVKCGKRGNAKEIPRFWSWWAILTTITKMHEPPKVFLINSLLQVLSLTWKPVFGNFQFLFFLSLSVSLLFTFHGKFGYPITLIPVTLKQTAAEQQVYENSISVRKLQISTDSVIYLRRCGCWDPPLLA